MYLVYDMGGTFIKYALMDEEGKIVEKSKVPTVNDKEQCMKTLQDVYLQYKDRGLDGIAMSVPGLVDVKNGIMHTSGAITSLAGIHMAEELSALCDGIKVSVENDGKAAALAEAWIGAAKDVPNCCVLGFGTGIAGATIIDKKAIRGNHLIAGEASWYPLNYNRDEGKVHAFMEWSTLSVCKKAAALLGKEAIDGIELFDLYREGNEAIVELVKDWFFAVGVMCYNLSLVVDPDVICIGGGISAEPLFIEGIQKAVEDIHQLKVAGMPFGFIVPKVVRCQYDNDSNLIGALYNFKQLYEN